MYNAIEKWKTVLESDIGDPIPSTPLALIVATSLELQAIENTQSYRIPPGAEIYAQYFLPMIRLIYSTVGKFSTRTKEQDFTLIDESLVTRDIFKSTTQEIHSQMIPVAYFDLSATIRTFEPYKAFGTSIQNLIQNRLTAFAIDELTEIINTTGCMPIWFLRCEYDELGNICVRLMAK